MVIWLPRPWFRNPLASDSPAFDDCAGGYRKPRYIRRHSAGPDRVCGNRDPMEIPELPNETWSTDFVPDALWSGMRFRTFNVTDDFNQESLRIEIDTSLPSARVIQALDELVEVRGKPKRLGHWASSPSKAVSKSAHACLSVIRIR